MGEINFMLNEELNVPLNSAWLSIIIVWIHEIATLSYLSELAFPFSWKECFLMVSSARWKKSNNRAAGTICYSIASHIIYTHNALSSRTTSWYVLLRHFPNLFSISQGHAMIFFLFFLVTHWTIQPICYTLVFHFNFIFLQGN